MGSNLSNKIKCLFGFHTFDEVWSVGHESNVNKILALLYSIDGHATLTVCGGCRTVAQFIYDAEDDDPWAMPIIKDHPSYFVAASPRGILYRFNKIKGESRQLDAGRFAGDDDF